MRLVVDASVALKWVIPEDGSAAAVALKSQELIAPSLWLAEAANGLWRLVLRGELGRLQGQAALRELESSPIASLGFDRDLQSALQLATELAHPIYDCLYLALALRERTHVVTADRRFAALVSKRPNLAPHIQPLAA
jgi:predicted nucleic acid-binding protein